MMEMDFGRFMRGALAMPRDRPAVLGEEPVARPLMLITRALAPGGC
jgi:hypothetical protein